MVCLLVNLDAVLEEGKRGALHFGEMGRCWELRLIEKKDEKSRAHLA